MTTMELATRPATASGGARPWPTLAVLLLGQFMGLLDVFIVNVAMPTIGSDLHASGAELQLVVGGYTVAYAMLLITGARLGDIYGRRRMYHLGVIGFTASSLICGLSPDIGMLIGFRFVPGAAAAVMVPQIISVIQLGFTGKARAKALSAYAVVLSVGAVAGLILGGVLVSADLFGGGWRPVFLVNVPVGVVLAVLVPRLVPADRPSGTRRLDLLGLAIAVPAVVAIVLPLILGHEVGWPAWTYASIAGGVVLAAIFVVVQRRTAARGGDPLVDFAVLRVPGMASGLITLVCAMVAYGGMLFAFTLHLQSGLGESALHAGLTWVPMAGAFGTLAYYWRSLPDRIHHLLPLIGLVLAAVGAIVLAQAVHGGTESGATLWTALVAYGAGLGLSISLLTHALVNVPPSQAADASGLLTTTIQLGQVTGVAAFGSLFLSLAQRLPVRASSVHAISTTAYWQAALIAVGAVAAVAVARSARRVAG